MAAKIVALESFSSERPGDVKAWFRQFEHVSKCLECYGSIGTSTHSSGRLAFAKFELLDAR